MPPRAKLPVRTRRGIATASVPPRRGSVQVSEVQRARMLQSAVAVISEVGYGEMSVARVAGRARVSRRTFYDSFEDREDCFLAVFDEAVARIVGLVAGAYAGKKGWQERVRAALAALLECFEQEPEVASLVVVEALGAGPRVRERRAEVLERLSGAIHEAGARAKAGHGLSSLTGEGVVGAVLSVIHTRLSQQRRGSMLELLNPLMSMIVLPYLGPAAAQRELERPAPKIARTSKARAITREQRATDPLTQLPMRITYRTLRVLTAITNCAGASNREIAKRAEVSDQGQISKLLGRLERLGLICNETDGQPSGEPNAWALTARGAEVQQALQPPPEVDGHVGAREQRS
jgi:AcrR family transcriptional regulator/DNA-binding MarR family transcriptional regulator